MKVTKDTFTISELMGWWPRQEGQTVKLKDADLNELQRFIDKMTATIKGKSLKIKVEPLPHMYGNRQIKLNMVRVAIVSLVWLFKYKEE